jgi:rubredoxin
MARWKLIYRTFTTDYWECTECGAVVKLEAVSAIKVSSVTYNYCPQCGVKMDK